MRMRCYTLGFLALAAGCASSTVESHTAPLTAPGALAQSLSTGSREAVERARIEPLFFGTAPDAHAATITSGPHFYAVSLSREGHSLVLHGVDLVHAEAEATPPEAAQTGGGETHATVRGRAATILVNEGIRSVAWEEGGTHWSVEVECFRPFDDPRCTQSDYVLAEAAALVSLRGAR
jgi:hypothetical protein